MTTWMLKAFALLGVAAAVALPATAFAQRGDPNHRTVDGMEMYLGVVRAEDVRSIPARGHPELTMHRGIPAGKGYYHINVSLIDPSTGAAVGDARVEARVEEVGVTGESKALEPMAINNTVSYGNYFRMPGIDPYWITVTVTRDDAPPQRATFQYKMY